jgi:hypothetical protein
MSCENFKDLQLLNDRFPEANGRISLRDSRSLETLLGKASHTVVDIVGPHIFSHVVENCLVYSSGPHPITRLSIRISLFGESPPAGRTSSSGLPGSIGHPAYTPVLACLSTIFFLPNQSIHRLGPHRAMNLNMRSLVSESPVVCEIARRPSRATGIPWVSSAVSAPGFFFLIVE